jgi:translation initiation factor 1A
MVKNTTGGNKHKRSKNSNFKSKRTIVYPDNKETLFSYVTRVLGDCRFEVLSSDEETRIATVRGSLYKNSFINIGDLVLIGLRSFETVKFGQKEKCDILLKYNQDEIDEMKANSLLKYKYSDKLFVVSSSSKIEKEEDDYFDNTNHESTNKIKETIVKNEDDDFDFDAI